MIKVMVLFYGLVMFVPEDGGLTVLFVDGGDHVPDAEHMPTAEVVGKDGKLGKLWNLEDGFKIVIQGPDGEMDPDVPEHFARLEKLFTYTNRGMVRQDCLNNDASCRMGDDDLVRGRVRVKGAWTAQPATYCNGGWSSPVSFDDTAEFQFRKRTNGTPHDEDAKPLATALRLEATVPREQIAQLVRLRGDEEHKSDIVVGSEVCRKWIDEIGEDVDGCVILAIGNRSEPSHGPHGFRLLDEHFTAFYRVALDPPLRRNRWLPYMYENPCCPEGYPPRSIKRDLKGELLNKPAPLCPPTYATAAEP